MDSIDPRSIPFHLRSFTGWKSVSVSVSTERDPGSIFLFHLASPSVLHSPMFIYYLILVQLSILNSFDRK